jgi:hypothetical protein
VAFEEATGSIARKGVIMLGSDIEAAI